jgi:hypothetical protein
MLLVDGINECVHEVRRRMVKILIMRSENENEPRLKNEDLK